MSKIQIENFISRPSRSHAYTRNLVFQAAIRTGMELGALVNVQTNVRISTVTHSMAPVYTDVPILMLLLWTA